MTARVVANPEELRRFASALRQFNGQVSDSLGRLQGQFGRLSETWQDQEHARFAAEFEHMVQAVRRYLTTADEHIPHLEKKAVRLQAYLDER